MKKAIVCVLLFCVLAHVPSLGEKMTGVFDFENKTVLLNSGYTMPILGLGACSLAHRDCRRAQRVCCVGYPAMGSAARRRCDSRILQSGSHP